MTATTTVNRWGAGYGIRITKAIAEQFPLTEKEKLEVTVDGTRLIISRAKDIRKHRRLEDYLAEYGWDGTTHELADSDKEWLEMPSVGGEVSC